MPYAVLEQQVGGWIFLIGEYPVEEQTDEDPPVRFDRHTEVIQIDGTLGSYDATERKIIIYTRGITR